MAQLNLHSPFERDAVVHHRGHAALVSQAALAVGGKVHQRLQARNSARFVRQYQIVILATADGAAGRLKRHGFYRNIRIALHNGKLHESSRV